MKNQFVLMPFARNNDSNLIVGIDEVRRGNQCNCRCLCCNTPVTARKADVNQWHFAHRTDDCSTSSECTFAPTTAIALILREQLPSLYSFNLDGFDFEDVEWVINKRVGDVLLDVYARSGNSNTSIAIEIPFANSKGANLERWCSLVDIVLEIDTHAIATSLYSSHGKPKLYSPERLLGLLLDNWNDWVYHFEPTLPQIEKSDLFSKNNSNGDESIQESILQYRVSHSNVCACCGINSGSMGKGLLCTVCVNKQVGSRFNNLTDMVRYYRK
ncbi:competence protein CoiA family protein [Vibrio cyclitrophicus]|uniref:competence protein CoiA family protein n=1 Tax=Vibrio cyclitrophicus TaxID=47951 RepID=UPI000C854AB8|nr:phosphatidylinositol kinase [Vibrio cyclitrophicus]PMG83916.1 hypothetical protein BCU82_20995 [Vibrio cyclitrophicus]